jgi:arginase family enzyme
MMELAQYLSPVNAECLPPAASPQSWVKHTHIYISDFPELQNAHIALFGLDDGAADAVRKQLYTLVYAQPLHVIDIGNIVQAPEDADTQFAIGKVIQELIDRKIVPIFITHNNKWLFSAYKSYEPFGSHITCTCMDARISLWDLDGDATYLNQIITHRPNFLFNINQLGYQSYFVEPDTLSAMQKMFFDIFRLGWVNSNIEETEPILRGTDFLTIDASCIRTSDAPGQLNGSPNGFFGNEICRITRYAGMSSKLSCMALSGLATEKDQMEQTALLYAQMIWYFAEGLAARTRENPEENPEGFTSYVMAIKENQHQINFFKSNRSDRWWMEVPNPHHKAEHHGPFVVPCSYNDYLQAMQDELPERWWNAYQRLL